MHRIKIPLQDFVLKMEGGGAYSWDTMVYVCILPYYISFPLFNIGSLHALSEEDG